MLTRQTNVVVAGMGGQVTAGHTPGRRCSMYKTRKRLDMLVGDRKTSN